MGTCRALFARTLVLSFVLQIAVDDEAFAQANQFPPPAAVNAMLDSLERVALTSSNPDERARAVLAISGPGRLWISAPGANHTPPGVRYPGIVDRLARIYLQSGKSSIRDVIVYWMLPQAERAEAAAFLAEVASQEAERSPPTPPGVLPVGHDTAFPLPYRAIDALTHMGPEGRAALERLQAQGTVREPSARVYLDQLAGQGFRRQKS